jgi:hypothetical protein
VADESLDIGTRGAILLSIRRPEGVSMGKDDIQFNEVAIDELSDEDVVRIFARSVQASTLRSLLKSAVRSSDAFSMLRSAARSALRSPGRSPLRSPGLSALRSPGRSAMP